MLALALAASLVAIAPTEVVHVATPQELQAQCGVSRRIEACTTLVAYALTASCTPDGRLTASAHLTPRVILMNKEAHQHELLHIADLRASVDDHLQRLEEARYASPVACRDAAARASLEFGRDLVRFAKESNEARHPFLRSARMSGR